jgi:predicted  nucleic acid-binding Zn-ribbon protein
MQRMDDAGPRERIVALAGLLTTLDRRVVDAFDTIARLGEASEGLDRLLEDGSNLTEDLRARMDRLEARVNADLDEVKEAVMAKLADLDLRTLRGRIDTLEGSIQNIEKAVTRVDGLIEGLVETVPDFITRRVLSRADRIEEESFPNQ